MDGERRRIVVLSDGMHYACVGVAGAAARKVGILQVNCLIAVSAWRRLFIKCTTVVVIDDFLYVAPQLAIIGCPVNVQSQ